MQQLQTLVPPDFRFRTAVLLLIWIGFAVWNLISPPSEEIAREIWPPYFIVGGFLVLLSLFDLHLRRGYQVSYDDNAIFWRKVGLRGRFSETIVMPFNAITGVFAESDSSGLQPLVVLRAGADDIPDILLSRQYLETWDIKALLSEVSARSEATFDEQVREFIEPSD